MDTSTIRALLPQKQREPFDDIVLQRVLGASRHIAMIGEMFLAVAREGAANNRDSLQTAADIDSVAAYFKATRGQASCAIGNAIDVMLRGMDGLKTLSPTEAAALADQAVSAYGKGAEQDIRTLSGYAAAVSREMDSILLFDYSSTVNQFLKRLGEEKRQMTVYIPESRIINGGFPYVATALEGGFKVHFIPDAALMYNLRQCDAAFFGAETFYADGTAFNTLGSDMVGLICREYHVPLYVLTPLIKLDTRPLTGHARKPVMNDAGDKMKSAGFNPEQMAQIDFLSPELVPVPPAFITAFITEEGIIPPTGMFGVSMTYASKLSGKDGYHESQQS